MKTHIPAALLRTLLVLAIVGVPVFGYEMTRSTIDGGGGLSTGGTYRVMGTVGQPDVARSDEGGYTLTGGFWHGPDRTAVPVDEVAAAPPAFRLDRAAPNPFNPMTTVHFELPVAARAVLRVYDISGRRVRTLVDEDLPIGRHQVRWDGHTDTGVDAASGIYVLQMRAGNFAATQKLTLLK